MVYISCVKEVIPLRDYVNFLKRKYKDHILYTGKDYSIAILQVGENEASNRYVRNKIKDCEEVGIRAHYYWYTEDISEEEFIGEIRDLQDFYDAIMVQLPLPPHINKKNVLDEIDVWKDVDGLTAGSKFVPATPLGIKNYLIDNGYADLSGKSAVVIGRSDLVGKPMAQLLVDMNATVTVCHSKTGELMEDYIKNADIIVCAVGKPGFLESKKCKDSTMIFDVGINFIDGKMVGDVINNGQCWVSPVPGGVGLLTRCALLENILKTKE